MPYGFTTVGYWMFAGLANSGDLCIYCAPLSRRRYAWAVIGHELIEAAYCWLRGITTGECDQWDAACEERLRAGALPLEVEPGDIRECPYYWGHQAGCWWERLVIFVTLASWSSYIAECLSIMEEQQKRPRISQKTLP